MPPKRGARARTPKRTYTRNKSKKNLESDTDEEETKRQDDDNENDEEGKNAVDEEERNEDDGEEELSEESDDEEKDKDYEEKDKRNKKEDKRNKKEDVDNKKDLDNNSDEEMMDASPAENKKRRKKKTPKKQSTAKKSQQSRTPRSQKKLVTGKKTIRRVKKKKDEKKGADEEEDRHPLVEREDANSLFAIVRQQSTAIGVSIDEWIKTYEADKNQGVSEIITFVIQSCGCMTTFAKEDVTKEDVEEVIQELTRHFLDIAEYPIVSKHKAFHAFGTNFLEFWDILVSSIKESILFDTVFLEFLVNWLTTLSSSKVRAFRHTATLALYQLIHALIEQVLQFKKDLSATEKQLKAARSQKNKKEEQQLSIRAEQYHSRIETLDETMNQLIESVFAFRFKDTVPDIRALSIQSLGEWLFSYQDKFLTDDYFKYLGWSLSDKESGVREVALKVVTTLFNEDEWQGKLSKFAKKFLRRIVEMTSDISIPVSDEALKLLTKLRKDGTFMEQTDAEKWIEDIQGLVFDKNASVRFYAAKFMFQHLAKKIKRSSQDKKTTKSTQRKKTTTDIKLETLLQWIRDFSQDMSSVPTLVVDAFWTFSNTVKDFDQLTRTLLDKADEMEEDDSLNLVRMLNAATKKIAGQLHSSTSTSDTVKVPKGKRRDKKEEEEQWENVSTHLAKELPLLLSKYQIEKEKIEELLEIPQYMRLSAYAHHEAEFDELLKTLTSVMWKHSDGSLFAIIAKTFQYLLSQDYVMRSKAQRASDEFIRDLLARIKSSTTVLKEIRDEDDSQQQYDKEMVAVGINLARLEKWVSSCSVNIAGFTSDMLDLLASMDRESLSQSCYLSLIRIVYAQIIWRFNNLTQEEGGREMKELQQDRDVLISSLVKSLEAKDVQLEREAYLMLCDLAVFFAARLLPANRDKLALQLLSDEVDSMGNYLKRTLDNLLAQAEEEVSPRTVTQLITAIVNPMLLHHNIQAKLTRICLQYLSTDHKELAGAVKLLYAKLKQAESASLWEYELDALWDSFEAYKQSEKQSEKLNKFNELASRIVRLHFPGKDTKHVAILVRAALNRVLDALEDNYLFLPAVTKYVVRLDSEHGQEILDEITGKVAAMADESDAYKAVVEVREALQQVSQNKKPKTPKPTELEDEEAQEEQQAARDISVTTPMPDMPITTPLPPHVLLSETPIRSRKRKTKHTEEEEEQESSSSKRKRNEDSEETQITQEDEGPSKKQKSP